jgi:enamine deaminase RidA (YjgF/YER057c/UK114 family)
MQDKRTRSGRGCAEGGALAAGARRGLFTRRSFRRHKAPERHSEPPFQSPEEFPMTITRFETGTRMSQAVVHNGTVYLAGQVSDAEGVEAQTKDILGQIDALLATVGSDKSRLLSATIYLADMSTFAEMNRAWDGWVAAGHAPARATVEAKLAGPQYRVEISVVAATGA